MTKNQLRESIFNSADEGHISCARAFTISEETSESPQETGRMLNELKIKLNRCQLGLFGYGEKGVKKKIIQPNVQVTEKLSLAIKGSLTDGKLSCKKVWELAERMKVSRLDIANACENMNIKINKCQLGAF
ncbi:MAG: hypothetical protein CVV44_22680 [Spirochaetae bacterium HGW-Spirochaetae-1]|jgi:hypothetical protein|nr:MAG: hypothetical protein CVV44_22680 [Spirochaetae bacterium HGW-Spirochaetae-1]